MTALLSTPWPARLKLPSFCHDSPTIKPSSVFGYDRDACVNYVLLCVEQFRYMLLKNYGVTRQPLDWLSIAHIPFVSRYEELRSGKIMNEFVFL